MARWSKVEYKPDCEIVHILVPAVLPEYSVISRTSSRDAGSSLPDITR
jgi:hypothetical protein